MFHVGHNFFSSVLRCHKTIPAFEHKCAFSTLQITAFPFVFLFQSKPIFWGGESRSTHKNNCLSVKSSKSSLGSPAWESSLSPHCHAETFWFQSKGADVWYAAYQTCKAQCSSRCTRLPVCIIWLHECRNCIFTALVTRAISFSNVPKPQFCKCCLCLGPACISLLIWSLSVKDLILSTTWCWRLKTSKKKSVQDAIRVLCDAHKYDSPACTSFHTLRNVIKPGKCLMCPTVHCIYRIPTTCLLQPPAPVPFPSCISHCLPVWQRQLGQGFPLSLSPSSLLFTGWCNGVSWGAVCSDCNHSADYRPYVRRDCPQENGAKHISLLQKNKHPYHKTVLHGIRSFTIKTQAFVPLSALCMLTACTFSQ